VVLTYCCGLNFLLLPGFLDEDEIVVAFKNMGVNIDRVEAKRLVKRSVLLSVLSALLTKV
jgi:hypothetical protein